MATNTSLRWMLTLATTLTTFLAFMLQPMTKVTMLQLVHVYVSGVNVVNWPIGRVLMSYFASKYVRAVTGFHVHDTTAGFVCYRRRVLETIPLDMIRFKGYAFQIEMKYTSFKIGFKIKEVPCHLRKSS